MIFGLVFTASLIRGILEILLLSEIKDIREILPFLSFWCIWYFVVFYTASAIISFFAKEKLEDVMKFISKFFFLIILPPIVDRFLFGRTQPYFYEKPEDILKHFFSFFLTTERVGKALVLNVLFIHFFVFLYTFFVVFKKERVVSNFSRAFLKAFARALLCFISLYTASTFYSVGGFLPVIFPLVPILPSVAIPFYNSVHGFFFSLLLFFLIFITQAEKLKLAKPNLKNFFSFLHSFGFNAKYIIPFLSGYIFSGFEIWYLPTFFYVGISVLFFDGFKRDSQIFFPILAISLFSPYILASFLILVLLRYIREFFIKELESEDLGERFWNLSLVVLFFMGYAAGKIYIFFIIDLFLTLFFLCLALFLNNLYLSFLGFVPFLTSGKPEFIFLSFVGYIVCVLLFQRYWKYAVLVSVALIYFVLKNLEFWFGL